MNITDYHKSPNSTLLIGQEDPLERWQEKSSKCVENLSQAKLFFKKARLCGVAWLVAGIAMILFSTSLCLQVVVGPFSVIMGFTCMLIAKKEEDRFDWQDYSQIETARKVKEFWGG